ncbi:unnamed protein product [Protopolystoma xenopodis]|uniref:Uncharacterized protein n=1 Tax=Protopolystoma xenopodis TaxID=117903 RepID=A0A448WND3_9PLAT|nr:unnamed protein product [Protopolystoma xenopodis]
MDFLCLFPTPPSSTSSSLSLLSFHPTSLTSPFLVILLYFMFILLTFIHTLLFPSSSSYFSIFSLFSFSFSSFLYSSSFFPHVIYPFCSCPGASVTLGDELSGQIRANQIRIELLQHQTGRLQEALNRLASSSSSLKPDCPNALRGDLGGLEVDKNITSVTLGVQPFCQPASFR